MRTLPLLLALTGCALTGGSIPTAGTPPAWAIDPGHGLDAARTLAGVGWHHGVGPESTARARAMALARLAERISADVASEGAFTEHETRDERGIVSGESRRLVVDVQGRAELVGVEYDLVIHDGTTLARARVDRAALADHYTAAAREALARGRRALAASRDAFADGRRAEALLAGARADAALSLPRDTLALVPVLVPGGGGRAGTLLTDLPALRAEVGTHVDALVSRLSIEAPGGALVVGPGGVLPPFELSVAHDGRAVPGLPLATHDADDPARLVTTTTTDADGRARVELPPVAGRGLHEVPLRVGVAIDGRPTAVGRTLPLSVPHPSQRRIAVVARNVLLDGSRSIADPPPSQAFLADALGRLGFGVEIPSLPLDVDPHAIPPSMLDEDVDALLSATFVTRPSSVTRVGDHTVHWYRTVVDVRFLDLATGETIVFAIDAEDDRGEGAGTSPSKAAESSLAAAQRFVTSPRDPDSLASRLRRAFP